MKKLTMLSIAILMLIIFVCLTGCNSDTLTAYQSVVADSANDLIAITSECDFWTGEYFVDSSKSGDLKTVSCDGIQYTGEYKKSIIEKLNSFTTDIYEDDNNIEFGINRNTGKLLYLNLMNKSFFDTEPYLDELSDPEKSAIEFAERLAAKYVTDLDAYEMIIEPPTVRYKEKDGQSYRISYHVITFARKINGYYTSDYISVKVTSKGNLASLKMGDIGAFSDVSIAIDSEMLQNSIQTKVKGVYSAKNYNFVESDIRDQKLVITPAGQIAIYSDIKIVIEDASAQSFNTAVAILTVIKDADK